MALPLGATTTTAASGGNRELLLGQRPAECKTRFRGEAYAGSRNPALEAKRLRGHHGSGLSHKKEYSTMQIFNTLTRQKE